MTINNDHRVRLHGDDFLENLPSSIPTYTYEGKEQFRRVVDFERDRFQRAIDADVQEYHRLQRVGHGLQSQNGVSSSGGNTCLGQMEGASRSSIRQAHPHPTSHQSSNTLEETNKPPNECVLFHISDHSLESDILDPSEPIRFASLSFDPATHLLLARMVTRTHAEINGAFATAVILALADAGLVHSVRQYPHVTIEGDKASGKEPDHGWGPMIAPQGFPDRPTVALEVAVSESQEKLERDVRWWLNPHRGNANLTVTIKVDRKKPRFTIAKWQRVDGEIERTQQIVVSKTQDEQITVDDGPLTIPFDLMFRRQAVGDEPDLIPIDEAALKNMAGAVWNAQGF